TISPQLQRAVEGALQEGLSRYERSAGRVQFHGAEANLSQAILRIEADKKAGDKRPAWQRALANARLPLYDVHWTPAIVLEKPTGKKGETWRVDLTDGRILPLSLDNATAQRKLTLYDVVLTHVTDGSAKTATRADLRVRPVVQGAVVVLENKTGRVLAMTGGFSYPLSQLNRATQAVRQPGSAIKPLSYLAALGKGLQPNTLISDNPITLPPIAGGRDLELIERNGVVVYRHDSKSPVEIKSVDRAAFYQLKTMLQGVLARGTARAIAGLSPYVAGKTGTSDDENDAWFVGFTNDVTVAVWIGYDNADGKRRTLGGGSTGGHVAVPIFEPVIQAVWAYAAPKVALAPPSPEAKRQLACKSVDLETGEAQSGRGKALSECFRVDRKGKTIDTQYRLMSHEEASHAKHDREDGAARKKEASAPRNGSATAPNSGNA